MHVRGNTIIPNYTIWSEFVGATPTFVANQCRVTWKKKVEGFEKIGNWGDEQLKCTL